VVCEELMPGCPPIQNKLAQGFTNITFDRTLTTA
jgi:hypothetical protein